MLGKQQTVIWGIQLSSHATPLKWTASFHWNCLLRVCLRQTCFLPIKIPGITSPFWKIRRVQCVLRQYILQWAKTLEISGRTNWNLIECLLKWSSNVVKACEFESREILIIYQVMIFKIKKNLVTERRALSLIRFFMLLLSCNLILSNPDITNTQWSTFRFTITECLCLCTWKI